MMLHSLSATRSALSHLEAKWREIWHFAASALVCMPIILVSVGCAEQEVRVCFPRSLTDYVWCVDAPSGSQCGRYALSGVVECVDRNGNISHPEPYRLG